MKKFFLWDFETEKKVLSAFSVPDYRCGRANVTEGATEVIVTFSSPISNPNNYSVHCTWQNTTDQYPQHQTFNIKSFTTSGFIASWNAPVDSENYKVNWICQVHS